MKLGDHPILQIRTVDERIELTWLCDEWKDWGELHSSAELREIITTAQADFKTAYDKSRKGLGKGKSPLK